MLPTAPTNESHPDPWTVIAAQDVQAGTDRAVRAISDLALHR